MRLTFNNSVITLPAGTRVAVQPVNVTAIASIGIPIGIVARALSNGAAFRDSLQRRRLSYQPAGDEHVIEIVVRGAVVIEADEWDILPQRNSYKHLQACDSFNDYVCGCGWCHDCGWEKASHA